MEIQKIYETASTDGYTHNGDGLFFLSETIATATGKNRHGSYSAGPICHYGIEVEPDKFLLLKSIKPIVLANSDAAINDAKKAALEKLTIADREILGL